MDYSCIARRNPPTPLVTFSSPSSLSAWDGNKSLVRYPSPISTTSPTLGRFRAFPPSSPPSFLCALPSARLCVSPVSSPRLRLSIPRFFPHRCHPRLRLFNPPSSFISAMAPPRKSLAGPFGVASNSHFDTKILHPCCVIQRVPRPKYCTSAGSSRKVPSTTTPRE